MTIDGLVTALIIFGLRVFNNAISTLRVVLITRDMRFWSSVLAFIEAFTFAVVISSVVKDLTNVPNMLAYCGGFSVGGYVGMLIEARFITSYMIATIITGNKASEIAQMLRSRGYGVTQSLGEGRDGAVYILRSIITRRDVSDFMNIVHNLHAEAFVSVSEARSIEHGWLRRMSNPEQI